MGNSLSLLIDRKKKPHPSYQKDFLTLVDKDKTKVANPVSLVEKVLISKLKVGDSSAFSIIFTAYYNDLVMFASRFTNDLNSAEEIVQDAFVRLWEEHESVNVSISIKSYLLRTVQNKCIDWYRHKKIMQTHNYFVLKNSPVFEYNTDSYILYSELQEQINDVLSKLPVEISEAFRMNRFKGLRYHEIADLMNVSVRTIEVRIGKALHIIRDHLKEYFR